MCAQIRDQLPDLKAIVQYKDKLSQQYENVYDVRGGVDCLEVVWINWRVYCDSVLVLCCVVRMMTLYLLPCLVGAVHEPGQGHGEQ